MGSMFKDRAKWLAPVIAVLVALVIAVPMMWGCSCSRESDASDEQVQTEEASEESSSDAPIELPEI